MKSLTLTPIPIPIPIPISGFSLDLGRAILLWIPNRTDNNPNLNLYHIVYLVFDSFIILNLDYFNLNHPG